MLRGLLCSSPLSGQDRQAGVSWYFPTHLLPSQKQRSKRSFPGALNEESTVTLRMTSKRSRSEQRQLLILFVAANILEGSQTKCISHRKPASCVLDGSWLCQKTLQICGVSFILGVAFANSAVFLSLTLLHAPKEYAGCPFAPLSPWAQGDARIRSCPAPYGLLYMTRHESWNHRPASFSAVSCRGSPCAAFQPLLFS